MTERPEQHTLCVGDEVGYNEGWGEVESVDNGTAVVRWDRPHPALYGSHSTSISAEHALSTPGFFLLSDENRALRKKWAAEDRSVRNGE